MDLLSLTLSLLALLWSGQVRADFNLVAPGPLTESHAPFEGRNDCGLCHEKGKQVVSEKCLDCHKPLQERIRESKGYHAQLTNKTECGKCHPEHAGKTLQLIKWEDGKDNFNHESTGFLLLGGHAKLKCEQCHEPRFIHAPAVKEWKLKYPKSQTQLGLPETCNSCHFDEHRKQVKTDCQECHDEVGWKKPVKFHHRDTKFPLIGKHLNVPCEKCHIRKRDEETPANTFPAPKKRTYLQFTGMPFSSCENCHKDVHEGRFSKECTTCHSPEGWNILASKKTSERKFHDTTRFPLRGAHIDVQCRLCHGPFAGKKAKFKGLPFGLCSDCHIDAHLGQISKTKAGKPKDCAECHDVNSFASIAFDQADHAKTRYPLSGSHKATPCLLCHAQTPALEAKIPMATKTWLKDRGRKDKFCLSLFRYPQQLDQCETCHKDPHKAQFMRNGKTKFCTTCHQVSSFKDLKFDHDRDSKYPLTGKHSKATCEGCHKKAAVVTYRGLATGCETCHDDIHVGQFTRIQTKQKPCAMCHTTEDFKKRLLFDHNDRKFSAFQLRGKHSSVKCDKCHPRISLAPKLSVSKYSGLPTTCDGCHVDQHKGAFDRFAP